MNEQELAERFPQLHKVIERLKQYIQEGHDGGAVRELEELNSLFTFLSTRQLQPIETAPKDGRDVLLYTKSGLICFGFFGRSGKWCMGQDGEIPTHWMPLPEVPK